jgi:hypothetical protein
MEYVDGEDLASLLRRIGHLPWDKGLEVARQVCSGMAAAHAGGVVHRDLKPANVMLDGRGRVRITDFGLAVTAEEQTTGETAGTPGYMAPEQLAGAPASVKTDVYALGLVLYEVVTGRPAFGGGSVAEVLRRQRETDPPRLSSIVPGVEPSVERVILRCLDRDPAQRPQSALAVAAALPGGDPLAALVAAGETPPPEMVADAGGRGALRPAAAWSLLAAVAAGIPIGLWLVGGITLVGKVALDKPPEVLADRARSVLEDLGYATATVGRYEAWGFRYDRDALAARRWPDSVRYWYRASPQPLRPRNPFARVSPTDPPPLDPAMTTVWLDARGRLLAFQLVPPREPALPGETPGWEPLFRAAGLDPEQLAPAQPSLPPPVGADSLLAWDSKAPGPPEGSLRVEAAAWRGRPVFFTLVRGSEPIVETASGMPHLTMAAFGGLNVVALVAGAVFARRNWRRGRGDRAGALRLALAVFVTAVISWVVEMSPLVTLERVWRFVAMGTELALWNAAFVWALYVAIEPFVRRRWPESLISWNRLLSGRFTDPRVGRDVLIGVAAMWTAVLVLSAGHVAPRLWGHEAISLAASDLGTAVGLRGTLVWLIDGIVRSASFCVLTLMLLLLMRTLLRGLWMGVLGVGILFALIIAPAAIPGANWTDAVGSAAIIVLLLGIAARVGLLAMAVFGFFIDPLFPITPDLGAWYGRPTLAIVLLTGLLAVYGFVIALGGRSPFGEAIPDD